MTGREVDIYWDFALLPSGEKIWTPVKTRKQACAQETPEELLAGTQAKGKKKQIPPQKPSTSSKINTYKFPTTNATPDFSGTTFPNLQTREKRPRTKSAPIVDIPDDQGGPKSRNIFVPKWYVLDTNTVHPKSEEQKYVNRDLFRAFELPIDRERYENVGTRLCLELFVNLFAKGNTWFNHALDQQVAGG